VDATPTRRRIALAGTALAAAGVLAVAPAAAQSAEEAAVARAVDALSKAMVAVDRAQLEALTAPQLSYGHSAGRIENQREFVDYLVARTSAFRSINLQDQTISVVGDAAIVRHMLVGETESRDGRITPVRVGVMQVWRKQGGDWKLFARQAYRV
jgi:ketosteroid isomerase-like protein